MAPLSSRGTERYSWERLPLASLATTILMVIQAAPLFALDRRQREAQNRPRRSTAWITQFVRYLDTSLLPNLPGHFGQEYCDGSEADNGPAISSTRVTARMLYDIAEILRLDQHESPTPCENIINLHAPLTPAVYACPSCQQPIKYRDTGHSRPSWIIGSFEAYRATVMAGICDQCRVVLFPDRYTRLTEDGQHEDVYFKEAKYLNIGKGRYTTRAFARAVGVSVVKAHTPLSTQAACWNACGPYPDQDGAVPVLTYKNLWRIFVIHHALNYISESEEAQSFIIPSWGDNRHVQDDEDMDNDELDPGLPDVVITRDEAMVNQALALFPSVPTTGSYRTYLIPGTANHKCNECAHYHRSFRQGEGTADNSNEELLNAHQNVEVDRARIVTAAVIDGIEKIGHKICTVAECGQPLVNYRDGRFCRTHLPFESKCGIKNCVRDASENAPACEDHLRLYRQFEVRFGRDRSIFGSRRQMRRLRAIDAGEQSMEWEPAPIQWDSSIEHYWLARHIKVVEIAVTACGIPLSHTKFPFAEGESNIADFMNATWSPNHPEKRPTYLAIDKGCKVMLTLNTRGELQGPGGWMESTNIKVDTWHYNGHGIDALCVTWCNPNDQLDPNLIQASPPIQTRRANARGHSRRARGRQADNAVLHLQRAFNFEAAEHLNADLEQFSAVMTKMKPNNHDLFMCIILKERAERIMEINTTALV